MVGDEGLSRKLGWCEGVLEKLDGMEDGCARMGWPEWREGCVGPASWCGEREYGGSWLER